MTAVRYVQDDQPPGVPPLELTGERTLPDIPAENYWYRRHLVVYEWIARRCAGMDVIDMACGEGYGSEVLATRAARVTGVDANPDAHEHAAARYGAPGVSFVRDLIDRHAQESDAIAFLQTVEHVENPVEVLSHMRDQLRPGGTLYVSTPNVVTLAPAGRSRSDNPWHVHEYEAAEFRELCESVFGSVELFGLFHARKLRAHELALKAGWDSVHARLGLTSVFYDRFTPAISARDFRLVPERLDGALDFLAVCRA